MRLWQALIPDPQVCTTEVGYVSFNKLINSSLSLVADLNCPDLSRFLEKGLLIAPGM